MKYIVTGFVILFLVIGIGLYFGEKRQDEYNTTCKDRGGVPFRSRDAGSICIKKDAVIE